MIIINYSINQIRREVSITYPLYQSINGKYFIGQTDFLPINNNSLLVGLTNPKDSNVNIYLNVSTLTSLQALGFVEFYLGYNLYGGSYSSLSTSTNTGYNTPPKGLIHYWEPAFVPNSAISIFTRYINTPGTEIVDGGQIILVPGKSFYIYISDSNNILSNLSTRVAFGWWEEPKQYCNY